MASKSSLKFDEIGYWSELKLDIIKKYAAAYSTILSNQKGLSHSYIDAFSGAGMHLSKATQTFVPGSPVNALAVNPPFREYHFIDLNPSKTSNLRSIIGDRKDAHIYEGDCNEILLNNVFPTVLYSNYRGALCLLDPYGLHLNWEVIKTAGQMKSIDMFLNFPVADMNRNVLWNNLLPDIRLSKSRRGRNCGRHLQKIWKSREKLMAIGSAIEWTEATWNPLTGCTKISPGCKNCYAERMSRRLQAMGQPNYADGFRLALHPHMLDGPLHWKKSRRIFVNSMSDLFQNGVPQSFIQKVFGVMQKVPQHQFQILTKRSERLLKLSPQLPWQSNIWMGVSVENAKYAYRIDHLRQTGAQVKFLSVEPLLGPLEKLDLSGIHWVIVGGESGPKARQMRPEWVRDIRDQCLLADVPFFFKQWGGRWKSRTGRVLDGRTWNQYPDAYEQSTQKSLGKIIPLRLAA